MARRRRRCPRPPSTCTGCLAWGLLPLRLFCGACQSFGVNHEPGECAACRRIVPLKKGYCRLCWAQASLEAKASPQSRGTVLEPFLRKIRYQQLFLADLQRPRMRGPKVGRQGRRARKPQPQPPQPVPPTGWVQLKLPIQLRRDFTRFDRRRHADLANLWLIRARATAQTIGEARGWSPRVAREVDRGLVMSNHLDGDKIRYSELFPALRAYGLSVERTVEVLAELGLVEDDRVPAFESWLERSLADLAPGIRADVEHWLRTLRNGAPRSRPHSPNTAWAYLAAARPVLLAWSERYDHLREVTREDILAAVDELTGHQRHHTLSVIRSLLRHCKKNRTIFRDPAVRLRVGDKPRNVIQPLADDDIDQAVNAATKPLDRLVLALAAIHAARPKAIRELPTRRRRPRQTGASPSPYAPDRWTTSPTRCSATGWTTGDPAGPTPPTRT